MQRSESPNTARQMWIRMGIERRLVDVSPLQVVAARHVVKFIAKIAVAVVEVDVEEQLGEGDGPNYSHPAGEEGSSILAERTTQQSSLFIGPYRITHVRTLSGIGRAPLFRPGISLAAASVTMPASLRFCDTSVTPQIITCSSSVLLCATVFFCAYSLRFRRKSVFRQSQTGNPRCVDDGHIPQYGAADAGSGCGVFHCGAGGISRSLPRTASRRRMT